MASLFFEMIGLVLTVLYALPFLIFYVLSKRFNQVFENPAYKKIKLGLALIIIGIIFLFFVNILGSLGIFDELLIENVYVFQIIVNLLFSVSYLILLLGMLTYSNNSLRDNIKMLFLVFVILLGIVSVSVTQNILLFITLILYPVSSFFLISSLLISSDVLRRVNTKRGLLSLVGVLILITDPIIYYHIFSNILNDSASAVLNLRLYFESSNNQFFIWRNIGYLLSSIGMILILIPHSSFLSKLLKKKVITYSNKDTDVEKLIKKLSIEMQKILGDVVITIFKLACKDYLLKYNKRVDITENMEIKNLKNLKQKELLTILVHKYYNIIGESATSIILEKIQTSENSNLVKWVKDEASKLSG